MNGEQATREMVARQSHFAPLCVLLLQVPFTLNAAMLRY